MEREEDGGPRANHHGNLVLTNPFPDVGPFLARHHAVKDDCRSGRINKGGRERFGPSGFSGNHEHLPSQFQRPGRGNSKQGETFCVSSLYEQTGCLPVVQCTGDPSLPFVDIRPHGLESRWRLVWMGTEEGRARRSRSAAHEMGPSPIQDGSQNVLTSRLLAVAKAREEDTERTTLESLEELRGCRGRAFFYGQRVLTFLRQDNAARVDRRRLGRKH